VDGAAMAWPKNLQERIEASGFYNLSELGRMFGRSKRMLHYYSAKKWLGTPRVRGGVKVYSLALAEIFFRNTVTPEQIDRALQTARNDDIVAVAASVAALRDFAWREALDRQGINLEAPK
jgi:DNA-binding transcriptional MerR regulator